LQNFQKPISKTKLQIFEFQTYRQNGSLGIYFSDMTKYLELQY